MDRSVKIAIEGKDQASPAFRSAGDAAELFDKRLAASNENLKSIAANFDGVLEAFKSSKEGFSVAGSQASEATESVGGLVDMVKELGEAFISTFQKGKELFDMAKGGAVGRLGVIAAIGYGIYKGGMAHVDSVNKASSETDEVHKGIEARKFKYGYRPKPEEIEANIKGNADALSAEQAKDNEFRENPLLYNNRLFDHQRALAAQNVESLESERDRLAGQKKKYRETGRLDDAPDAFGDYLNKGIKSLAGKAKFDLTPLNRLTENAQSGLINFKGVIEQRKKDTADALQIKKDSRAPEEIFQDRLKEINRLKGFLGKEGVGKAQREAKLKLAADLGLDPDEDHQRGPTRFSATQSRLLNVGQGFEDPQVAQLKKGNDLAAKQVILLGKVQEWLDAKAIADKGAVPLKAG